MKTSSSSSQAAIACIALVSLTSVLKADVPADMRKDFVTARNHITMKWNPQGYWTSPPGAFVGQGNFNDVCAAFTQTEMARGKIPAGYSFTVNGVSQFVVSNGPISKLNSSLPPPAAPAPTPVAVMPQSPPSAPVAKIQAPVPPDPAPPAKRSLLSSLINGKTEQTPPPASVKKAAPLVETPPPPPVVQPRSSEGLPMLKTVPQPPPRGAVIYSATVPNSKAPRASASEYTPRPAPQAQPTAAMRAAVLDPITAAPQPTATAISAPAGPTVNGIPADMQKSYLSRHKPVFMLFDKDTGKWKSSEGAIKDPSTADEWCKQATAVDRLWKRIPEAFSYKHVGGGQVEVTRD